MTVVILVEFFIKYISTNFVFLGHVLELYYFRLLLVLNTTEVKDLTERPENKITNVTTANFYAFMKNSK